MGILFQLSQFDSILGDYVSFYLCITDILILVLISQVLKKWRNTLEKAQGYTNLEMDCEQIKRCIQIGLICVNPERIKRPTINKVVDMLHGLESMNWYISNELTLPEDHV